MSAKFEIFKDADEPAESWFLRYPDGFTDEPPWGKGFATFTDVVAGFITASEAQCPMCQKGAVVDTDWGWECTACGSYDVAVGYVKP